jgi:hypothetical protein
MNSAMGSWPITIEFEAFSGDSSDRPIKFTGSVGVNLDQSVISETLASKFPARMIDHTSGVVDGPVKISSKGSIETKFRVLGTDKIFKTKFSILPDCGVESGTTARVGGYTGDKRYDAMFGRNDSTMINQEVERLR